MFGSAALEFGIGMVFVYLMLSLAVTALQEGLASLFRRRARTLASGIRNLLRDDALLESVYAHPLIQGLHLSKRQAQRMWSLDDRTADVIFSALEAAHFLRRIPNDVYIRADLGC